MTLKSQEENLCESVQVEFRNLPQTVIWDETLTDARQTGETQTGQLRVGEGGGGKAQRGRRTLGKPECDREGG